MNNKKNTVLITGGAGFIGSHTVDFCIKNGYSVTVYDIKPWKEAVNLHHQDGNISYVEGDILDVTSLEKAMQGHTHVLHLAALVSVPESIQEPVRFHETNVTGTLKVFNAARKLKVVRVVYASSAAVYGAEKSMPITEDALLSPSSPYGLHKLINEQYAHLYKSTYSLNSIGLRYFNVFGLRQDPDSPYSGVISIFAKKIKNNEPVIIYGDGSATRDFVSVKDVARANLLALNTDDTTANIFNVGSGVETTIIDLLSTMNSIVGKQSVAEFKEGREGDIQNSCASIEKISTELGCTVTQSLKDGLGDLLNVR